MAKGVVALRPWLAWALAVVAVVGRWLKAGATPWRAWAICWAWAWAVSELLGDIGREAVPLCSVLIALDDLGGVAQLFGHLPQD